MISATNWVPRGFSSEFPEKYVLDDEEVERINQLAQLNLDDAKATLEEAEGESGVEDDAATGSSNKLKDQLDIDDDLKEYNLEEYDDEEIADNEGGKDVSMFPGLSNDSDVKFHEGEKGEDPYISLPNQEDSQEEKQELQVYPSDNLVLAARTEDDVSYLDIYVYDDGAGFHSSDIPVEEGDEADPDVARGLVRDPALYVHHDLMLPAFPLCVEWLDYKVGSNSEEAANYAAIGTFDPQIEIWNLDCVDKAFPDMILGEPLDNSMVSLKSKKKKKKSKTGHITTHHTDAVLSMAHNKYFRSVLASTSADHTVKLWDLNSGNAARSLASIHSNKNVSSSEWHMLNGSILLTGGYDSRVALTDVRISDESQMSKYWSAMAGEEIETVTFASENIILCGTDSGNVYSFDIRNNENRKPVWTLKAHDAGISTLCSNKFIPGMMSTGAMGEKTVKLWKFPLDDATNTKGPSMVLSRDFDVGNVLTSSFAPDIEVAGTMVIGGVNKVLKLWDVFTNRSVRKSFKSELENVQARAKEEAQKLGKSSRIARKYTSNDNPDNVITIDDQGEDEEEREGEDEHDDMA
ncbi:Pwp1p [Saccharomyces cerevisiae R103]|nr:Pwp1p [Saccharomyces cerevisiae R103]